MPTSVALYEFHNDVLFAGPGLDLPISLLACASGPEEIRTTNSPDDAMRTYGFRGFGAANLSGLEAGVESPLPDDGVRLNGPDTKSSGLRTGKVCSAMSRQWEMWDLSKATLGRKLSTATYREGEQTYRPGIPPVAAVANPGKRTPSRGEPK
jgi:hypothetical protein